MTATFSRPSVLLRKHGVIGTALAITIIGGMTVSCRRSVREEPTAESVEELAGLSPQELREVQQYISKIEPGQFETPVEVNTSLVTSEDVWLGMRYEGLHRYDRKTRTWRSYQEEIGDRIQGIRQEDSRVWVDHETWGNHTYFYVSYTDDRGATWKDFLIGDASGDYVHAPEFTNQGLRSERLERITASLGKGQFPEDLVEHLEVDGETYFTIYVNSSKGWNVLYRYDAPSDRLRDLAITDLDSGAVGVRQLYLDPYETRLLWILSGGWAGAVQSPRRWFVYDRKTEAIKDTGIDYAEQDAYRYLVDDKRGYIDIISFEPDRVLFLGADGEQIKPVAQYDRATKRVEHL